MKPVEEVIVLLIKALQDIGIPVLGLTARDPELQPTTVRQLKEINIDFANSNYWSDEEYPLEVPNPVGKGVYFYKGIIFCDENNKGICLDTFLKRNNYNPSHYVFADDREKHITRVKEALNPKYFVGVHYTNTDYKKSHPFNLQNALAQLNQRKAELSERAIETISTLKLG